MNLCKSYQWLIALLFLIFMHFAMPSPGGYGLYLAFNAVTWIFVSLIIGLGLWQVSQQKKLHFSHFHIITFAGLLLLCLPMFYGSPHSDFAIPRLVGLAAGLLFLLCIYQFKLNKAQHVQVLLIIVGAIALQASVGLLQVFVPQLGTLLPFIPSSEQPSGVFLQTNVMSSFMATGIALTLYLLVQPRLHVCVSATQTPQLKEPLALSINALLSRCVMPLLLFTLFSCSFSLFYIQSKTGVYGAIIASIFLLPYLYKANIANKGKYLFAAVALIAAGGFFGDHVKNSRLTDEPKPLFEAKDVREDMFKVGFLMIKDNPIAGYGYGGFSKEYREYHLLKNKEMPALSKPLKNLDHPHNEIILWGVEGGIVALLGLCLFAIGYLSLFYKINLIQTFSLFALVAPILLHTETEYPFYHSAIHWTVFLLLLNYTLFRNSHDNAITTEDLPDAKDTPEFQTIALTQPLTQPLTPALTQPLTKPLTKPMQMQMKHIRLPRVFIPQFFAVFIAISGTAFMLTTLQTTYYVYQFEADGSTNRNILLKASNLIVWRKHIEQKINNQNLPLAVYKGNTEGITDYLTWGLAYVAHTPSEKIYNNMVLAMQALHDLDADYDEQQGIDLILDAMRLYPDRIIWGKPYD